MSDNKVFLLDAYALIYRAYYGFIKNPRFTSKGMNTSAILGFTNTLFDILTNEKPSHIGVVFDPSGKTFRHEIYPQYKAHRPPTPEDIKIAVPYVKEIIKAFNIPVLEVAGFEADDVIGTLAKKGAEKGFNIFMMTPDKDYAQLVTDKIFMYKPKKGASQPDILGVDEILRDFNIKHACQVIDILGLMGDSADNIPGCPGIGPKGAQKLIASYDSIEGIYEHLDELKGKQKENLSLNKEQVLLSKVLAIIKTDVDIEFNENDLLHKEYNYTKLKDIFNELEFYTLAQRVLKNSMVNSESKEEYTQASLFDTDNNSNSKEPESIKTINKKYYLCDTKMKRDSLRAELSVKKEFCFDVETTGLDCFSNQLVGISFSYAKNEAFYVPIPENQEEASSIILEFKHIFEDENILKIGQNIKFDIKFIEQYGIEVRGNLFDTMVAHYVLHPEQKHNLDNIALTTLNYQNIIIEDIIGKGAKQKSMRDVEIETIKNYACEDADITYQLKSIFLEKLEKTNDLELFNSIEMPLVRVLKHMENSGVTLDTLSLNDLAKDLNQQIETLEKSIIEMAGEEFNVASPKQLGEILFEKMQLDPKAKRTKSGQFSTSENVLVKLKNKHQIIEKILEFRSLKKLVSTYVESLPNLINTKTGKIHANFNQTVAATGRLSSSEPNLQNIPIRTDNGQKIRKAFIPSETNIILSADYSQIELRLMAHMSEDKNLIEAFNNKEDIHTATAAKIFKVENTEVTSSMRSKAKTANFGIIYGISSWGLAERLNISRKEGKQLIDGYFESYPGVKKFMDDCIVKARENKYVETILGRKRYLHDIDSSNSIVRGNAERNAINTPMQGSAADIIKIAMNNIYNRMQNEGLQSKLILQVHDELNFDCKISELEQLKDIVKTEMENAVTLKVPLTVNIDTGSNWMEAH